MTSEAGTDKIIMGGYIIESTILFIVQLQYPIQENLNGGLNTIIRDPRLPKKGAGVALTKSMSEENVEVIYYLTHGMIMLEAMRIIVSVGKAIKK